MIAAWLHGWITERADRAQAQEPKGSRPPLVFTCKMTLEETHTDRVEMLHDHEETQKYKETEKDYKKMQSNCKET